MGFKDAQWAYELNADNGVPTKSGDPGLVGAVLVAVCHHTDDKSHQTIVGQHTIATRLGTSDRTVMRSLGVLSDLGIISTEARYYRGYRTSDRITVNRAYVPDSQVTHGHVTDSPNSTDSQTELNRLGGTAEEITQIGHPVGHPVLGATTFRSMFEEAWRHWPRGDKKKDALTKFLRVPEKQPVAAAIVRHGDAYRLHDYGQYTPMLVTWLNGERWTEQVPGPREDHRPTTGQRNLAYIQQLANRESSTKELSA